MASSDFLAWAIAIGANVEPQADYAADAALGPGVNTGVALSPLFNKSMRQATFFSAVISNFIVNQLSANVVDDGDVNGKITQFQNAILQLVGGVNAGVAPGSLVMWPTTIIPAGYFLCDGSTISRTTYAALNAVAAAVSYHAPFGAGDGSTSFRLPDFRGYFPRGYNFNSDIDPGRTIGSIQQDAFESHTHQIRFSDNNSGGGFPGHGGNNNGIQTTTATGDTETRPINLAINFIIKT